MSSGYKQSSGDIDNVRPEALKRYKAFNDPLSHSTPGPKFGQARSNVNLQINTSISGYDYESNGTNRSSPQTMLESDRIQRRTALEDSPRYNNARESSILASRSPTSWNLGIWVSLARLQ